MGYIEGIKGLVTNNANWKGKDPKQFILDIIRGQMRKGPDIIGEPIDILELTASSEKWLTPKRGCN